MCELCHQVQPDLTNVRGVTVCRSARYCMLYALKAASDLQIARMRAAALESTLTTCEVHIERLTA